MSLPNFVFHNGRVVPYSEVKFGVLTHALNYGTAVFGGLRAYWNEDEKQLFIFRPHDHFRRFLQSGKLLCMELQTSGDNLLKGLVELIRGIETSDETAAAVRAAAERMGKTVAEAHDYPGFISNRILVPMINEAIFALGEGLGTPEDIDAAMKLGTNQPMGPLELADFIGLDVCLTILEVLQQGFRDPRYRPCPLLRRLVDAGHLGRKTGRGFYAYPAS